MDLKSFCFFCLVYFAATIIGFSIEEDGKKAGAKTTALPSAAGWTKSKLEDAPSALKDLALKKSNLARSSAEYDDFRKAQVKLNEDGKQHGSADVAEATSRAKRQVREQQQQGLTWVHHWCTKKYHSYANMQALNESFDSTRDVNGGALPSPAGPKFEGGFNDPNLCHLGDSMYCSLVFKGTCHLRKL